MRDEFEENGYVLLRGVLDAETLASLNHTFDEHIQTDSEDRGSRIRITQATFKRETRQVTDRHGNRYEGKRFWSDDYRSLIDHPRVLPILRELLGQPEWGHAPPNLPPELRPRIRLDHDNTHWNPGCAPGQEAEERSAERLLGAGLGLHGGCHAHHITAVWELQTVEPGTGACPTPIAHGHTHITADRPSTAGRRVRLLPRHAHHRRRGRPHPASPGQRPNPLLMARQPLPRELVRHALDQRA